jgi:hypothetical protein
MENLVRLPRLRYIAEALEHQMHLLSRGLRQPRLRGWRSSLVPVCDIALNRIEDHASPVRACDHRGQDQLDDELIAPVFWL